MAKGKIARRQLDGATIHRHTLVATQPITGPSWPAVDDNAALLNEAIDFPS
jgi:hypothetical protein